MLGHAKPKDIFGKKKPERPGMKNQENHRQKYPVKTSRPDARPRSLQSYRPGDHREKFHEHCGEILLGKFCRPDARNRQRCMCPDDHPRQDQLFAKKAAHTVCWLGYPENYRRKNIEYKWEMRLEKFWRLDAMLPIRQRCLVLDEQTRQDRQVGKIRAKAVCWLLFQKIYHNNPPGKVASFEFDPENYRGKFPEKHKRRNPECYRPVVPCSLPAAKVVAFLGEELNGNR